MKERTTPDFISHLKLGEIFVFGSNLAGRHGKGAALIARQKFGAIPGEGFGHHGRTFAIPCKDGRPGVDSNVRRSLPLHSIGAFIAEFIEYARTHATLTFLVIEIGCGNAHYTPKQIAPLFSGAIEVNNIHLPASFWEVIKQTQQL